MSCYWVVFWSDVGRVCLLFWLCDWLNETKCVEYWTIKLIVEQIMLTGQLRVLEMEMITVMLVTVSTLLLLLLNFPLSSSGHFSRSWDIVFVSSGNWQPVWTVEEHGKCNVLLMNQNCHKLTRRQHFSVKVYFFRHEIHIHWYLHIYSLSIIRGKRSLSLIKQCQ